MYYTIFPSTRSATFAAASGVASAFICSAMRNHQHFNADAFAAKGAADEGAQSQLAVRQLCRYLLEKYDHPEHLARMAERMKALATPDAAAKVSDLVEGK